MATAYDADDDDLFDFVKAVRVLGASRRAARRCAAPRTARGFVRLYARNPRRAFPALPTARPGRPAASERVQAEFPFAHGAQRQRLGEVNLVNLSHTFTH